MDNPDTNGELSWFELFVDPTVVSKAILDPEKKKQLPKLCMQFTDKGLLAEREKERGKLAVEELMLFERKSASMKLCAMATFAALDFDIEFVIDNIHRNELLTLRVLADNFYRIYNEKNLDATFGNWLFYRFVLSIDRRNRLDPPAPRATIATTLSNGQIMPLDPASVKHEKTQRTILELKDHIMKAKAFITELSEVPRDIVAPGIQCFLKPFVELAPKAMTAAFLGDRNVLIENPSADFEAEKVVLPAADVANKCLSELVVVHYTNGELLEAKKILSRVTKPKTAHPMVAIDEDVFRAYCAILNVKGTDYSTSGPIKPYIFDLNALNDEEHRKSEVWRQRGVQETSGQLQSVYKAENAACSVAENHPQCIRDAIKTPAEVERFSKVLKKKLEGIRDKRRLQRIRAQLQFLCATIPDLRKILAANEVDVKELRQFVTPSQHQNLERPPSTEQISNSLRGTDPFWALMTEFDVHILKMALVELGPFWFPLKMPVSEFLLDTLETRANTPIYTITRLFLSKLYQLSRMHDFRGYLDTLGSYKSDLGQDMNVELALESVYVKSLISNAHMPWKIAHSDVTSADSALIFNQNLIRVNENSAKMYNQCISLMLNLGDHQIVFDKGGQIPIDIFKCIPIARMFGAFIPAADESVAKKCADGFLRSLTPVIVGAQPPRGGGRREHDAEKKMLAFRSQLVLQYHMMSLVKQKNLLDFILAYFVFLHNRNMLAKKQSHLKIHAKLVHLYSNETSTNTDIPNLDDVHQFLRMIIEKAYSISKTDEDTLRTYADFLYIEKDYQGAAQKYMEYFAVQDPLFRINFIPPERVDDLKRMEKAPEKLYDEQIFHRLRICTAHSGFLTMSLLTCQWLRTGKSKSFTKSMRLLANNETRDVGANCAEFIIDIQAVELLSQHYQANRMTKSLNTLYTGASSLSANQNVGPVLSREEMKRRTCRMLTTLSSTYFGLHI
ncbi:unnamed protein product [Caenorhabditis nigoni]